MINNRWKITYDAPVTLTLIILSGFVLLINGFTDGWLINNVFMCYRTSFADIMQYIRLGTHILGHSSWEHFLNNALMLLVISPMVEERYGSGKFLFMTFITAIVTGLINILIYPATAILGASGIVFMVIILASCVNFRARQIPLTLILVVFLYIGKEIISELIYDDNIAHISHIIGGLCGGIFGILFGYKQIFEGESSNKNSMSDFYKNS